MSDDLPARSGHQLMVRPSFFHSFFESSSVKTSFSGKLTNRHLGTIWNSYENIVSAIISLLYWGSPSAIARFVVPIVVDALNAMRATWARSHMFVKSSKALSPCFAHGYAPSTISKIVRFFGDKTSAFNFGPNSMFWASTKTMPFTIFHGEIIHVIR